MVVKKFLSLSICLLIATVSFAQTQQGYVKTKGRMVSGKLVPGQGLKGATVSVQGRTPVLVNADDGAFSFPVPVTQFRLDSVNKKGYQLVDAELCPKTYERSSNPLYIVMETPEQQLQDKLNAERKIRRNLQKQLQAKEDEIEALMEENKISMEEYQKSLQQLYAEQEDNEQLISSMAKRYSELDYDQLDEFYRQVSYYIEEGHLVKADSMLNTRGDITTQVESIKLRGQVIKEQDEKLQQAKAVQAADIDEAARRCYSYHETFLAQHLNDTAAYYLGLRASMDNTNIKWQLDAGTFYMDYVANYDKAMSFINMALHQAQLQDDPSFIAEVYNNIGSLYFAKGDFVNALENQQTALEIYEKNMGKDLDFVADVNNNIGLIYIRLSELSNALACFTTALDIRERIFGKNAIELAPVYRNIGLVYEDQNDNDKALEYYLKALEIQEKVLGPGHKDLLMTYNSLGNVYSNKADHEKALEYHHKCLNILETIYGKDHPFVAVTYGNIGYEYFGQGNYAKALEYFQIDLEKSKKSYGENHSHVGTCYFNLGKAYSIQNDNSKALEYYNKALTIRKNTLGEEHPKVAYAYINLSQVYLAENDFDEAMEYTLTALKILEKAYGEDSPNLISSLYQIGSIYKKQGDYTKALEYYRQSLQIQTNKFGEDHPNVIKTREIIAEIEAKMKGQGEE